MDCIKATGHFPAEPHRPCPLGRLYTLTDKHNLTPHIEKKKKFVITIGPSLFPIRRSMYLTKEKMAF